MFKRKKLDLKFIVIIIVVVIISLLTFFHFYFLDDRPLTKVEKIIKDGLIFTENIIFSPFRVWLNYYELRDIKEDYRKLLNDTSSNEVLESENESLKRTIEELKELLKIDEILTDYDKLNATVTDRNINYWNNTLVLNKGEKDGVLEGMAVVTNKGLIGRIIKVTYFTSEVKLITTSQTNSKISAGIVLDNDYLYGIISGYDQDDKGIILSGISSNKEIPIGSNVTTSGFGGLFPSGIHIGKVKSIKYDSYGLSKEIRIESDVDFDNVRYVSILRKK